MKIFLDIDGVMVPAYGWKPTENLFDGIPAFSRLATTALKSFNPDGIEVILTTSHKSYFTIPQWKKIFKLRGIEIKHLSRLDDNTEHLNRKDELLKWFNTNGIPERFLIIDDDKSLNDLPENLKNNLILTNPLIGLTEDNLVS